MTVQYIKNLIGDPRLPDAIRQVSINRKLHKLSVNNHIVLPVNNVSSYIKRDRDISIKDDQGKEIAILVLTKSLEAIPVHQFTTKQFIAFLNEADSFVAEYKFVSDYIVIHKDYYNIYKKNYYKTSPIWGGFSHPYHNFNFTENVKVEVNELYAIRNLTLKGDFLESSIRALQQPYGFERFLKYYHLLELNFDYFLIEKIKKLDTATNSDLIGKLLNEYADNETVRLTNIISDKCTDINSIVVKLNSIDAFPNIAFEIFNKYGSRKDILKEEVVFNTIIQSGDFSEANFIRHSVNYQRDYNGFIQKLAAYWIYRIRCSIAHNTIGEYILKAKDEDFIVKFGEPLLKEVLVQCFKN